MNFGYGDILDYLMSIHRSDLAMAVRIDTGYIIQRLLSGTTPRERAMIVLDYIFNYDCDEHSEVFRSMVYYGRDVLGASLCGIPLGEIARRSGNVAAMKLFSDVEVPACDKVGEATVARIAEMFKADLVKRPVDLESTLLMGMDFLQRECFDEQGPDDFKPKKM